MGIFEASPYTVDVEARKHAEEKLLPLEGVAGVSHREDPPMIVVYVEHERYRSIVPPEIDGYKTEVIVIGKIKALSLLQLEEVKLSSFSQAVSRLLR